MKKTVVKIIEIAGGGLVGFVNGFFGGGGGMLLVPLMEKGLGLPTKRAHATAILLILPMCIASGITYIAGGVMDWSAFGLVTVGVIVGGLLGAVLLKKISPTAVGVVFALLMLAVGVKLAVQ